MTSPTPSLATLLRSSLAGWLLVMAACGGGVETGGTGASAYVQGPISGFGSIVVSGVHFDDSSAAIEDPDGEVHTRDALRLGMIVEVESGHIADDDLGGRSATATRIRVASELVGPLTDINLASSRLVVLGQTVRLSGATVVGGVAGGTAALTAGDVVSVFGFFDPAGTYVATRVERLGVAPSNYRVSGVAQDVNAVADTLRIGSQVFDLGAIGIPSGLTDGQYVRLALEPAQVGGRWVVTRVVIDARSDGRSRRGRNRGPDRRLR